QGPPEAASVKTTALRITRVGWKEDRPSAGGGGAGLGMAVGGVAVVAVAAKGGPEGRARQGHHHQGLRAKSFARGVETERGHLEGAPDGERDRAEALQRSHAVADHQYRERAEEDAAGDQQGPRTQPAAHPLENGD